MCLVPCNKRPSGGNLYLYPTLSGFTRQLVAFPFWILLFDRVTCTCPWGGAFPGVCCWSPWFVGPSCGHLVTYFCMCALFEGFTWVRTRFTWNLIYFPALSWVLCATLTETDFILHTSGLLRAIRSTRVGAPCWKSWSLSVHCSLLSSCLNTAEFLRGAKKTWQCCQVDRKPSELADPGVRLSTALRPISWVHCCYVRPTLCLCEKPALHGEAQHRALHRSARSLAGSLLSRAFPPRLTE